MAIESRLSTLDKKHKQLETKLSDLLKSPSSDAAATRQVKQMKLRIKDEIESLKTRH